MANKSQRLAIAKSLLSVVQNVIDPATNLAYYQTTKLGAIYDPGANVPFVQVTHYQGESGPYGSGGNLIGWRRQQKITYLITSGFGPYQPDDETTQSDMLYAMDLVLPILESHYLLPDATNPSNPLGSEFSFLPILTDRSIVTKWPNGQIYLLWHLPVIAMQQYSITQTIP
jgi:hypothetical protein